MIVLDPGEDAMRRYLNLLAILTAATAAGCVSTPAPIVARAQAPIEEFAADSNGEKKSDSKSAKDEQKEEKAKEPPKTLFEWAIGPENKGEDKSEEEDVIVTDRPDFTEAPSTVGLNRVQVEAGYTYYRGSTGGTKTITHTYPETLIRAGLFADWLELRLAQSYTDIRTTVPNRTTEQAAGLDDLSLGVKIALVENKGWLPALGLILQTTVPTGGESQTANRALPGADFLFQFEIIPDLIDLGGSTEINTAVDDLRHTYMEFSQSVTVGYTLTKQLGAYTEWFAFFPSGAIAPDVTPQHYFNGGFSYKFTPDFQVDIRAGAGLNHHSTDFFTGVGFAVRY